ncbi:MAG: SpoIIE family protein phosphatase [Bacteroidota bacterium]|nr:SpoIIE family protein phosphatase [Candidatus Kapabacteria bacterium]MDW8220312.1 SpoIIE family protein phosphatase [Bacteroidota bacterium]
MKVLIIDDSEDIHLLVSQYARIWGYDVVSAYDGLEALRILETSDIQLVISDWSMPAMSGIELCRIIRERFTHQRYIYIILLTARQEKEDLVTGMEAGADDFIRKPFHKDELRVRLRAGERALRTQQALAEQNKRLAETQAALQKELEAASIVQRNLLPNPTHQPFRQAGYQFDLLYIPATYLGGDTCNFISLSSTHAGFYIIDVAGHGIAASLKTVMLSQHLSLACQRMRLLLGSPASSEEHFIRPPNEVLYHLNTIFTNASDAMQYFTIIYGVVNTQTGYVTLSNGGHLPALVLRNDGTLNALPSDGIPLGMFDDVEYSSQECMLGPGDRLILYTDGITECEALDGKHYSHQRFEEILRCHAHMPLRNCIGAVYEDLVVWHGSTAFDDDISLFIIERLL